MYKTVMIPVDLSHLPALEKALETGADLANHYGASVCYVSVTTTAPSPVAHNPTEFGEKLAAFAAEEGHRRGLDAVSTKVLLSHDPAVDLDNTLITAVEETGADLVVIGSHRPGFAEHLFASHGGRLAAHAPVSVMVVR